MTAALIVVGLALIVVGAAVVQRLTASDAAPAPNSTASSTPRTAPAPHSGAGDGRCQVAVGDDARAPSPPADLAWAAGDGFTWPESASVGPTQRIANGLGVCFAHSPLGAVMAATVISTAVQGGHTAHQVYRTYALDSPGKTAALAKPDSTAAPLPAGMAVTGYQVVSYSSEQAVISVVFTAPGTTTGFAATSVTLTWADDDWKVRPQDDTRLNNPGLSTPTLGEFTRWRP